MKFLKATSSPLMAIALLLASMGLMLGTSPRTANAIPGKIDGNVAVNSQYIFRGGIESTQSVVNGGVDYSHPSGMYAGYWASDLGNGPGGGYPAGALENDFYAGYSGSIGQVSYDVGFLQYIYSNAPGNDANEVYGALSYGPFSVSATLTTKAASWTEEDDLWYSASYSKTVMGDITVSAKVLANSLEFDSSGDGPNRVSGEDGLSTIEVGLSHPIGDSGADFNYRYIATDTDNSFNSPDNQIVFGVSYGFGIYE